MSFRKHPITEYRAQRNMSQQTLGSEAKLSISTIHRLESVGLEGARIASLQALAQVMGIRTGELVNALEDVSEGFAPQTAGRKRSPVPFNDAWAALATWWPTLQPLGSSQHKHYLGIWLAEPQTTENSGSKLEHWLGDRLEADGVGAEALKGIKPFEPDADTLRLLNETE